MSNYHWHFGPCLIDELSFTHHKIFYYKIATKTIRLLFTEYDLLSIMNQPEKKRKKKEEIQRHH